MQIGFDAKRLFKNFTGLGHYSRFILHALITHYPQHAYWLYSPKYIQQKITDRITTHASTTVIEPAQWVSMLRLESYWRSVSLGKLAYQDGADIFHGLSNELPMAKAKGLKTVVTIHDVIFKRYPQFYHPIDVKIYALKIAKACQDANRIIAISQQTADDLHTYFKVDKNKIRIVYQGCSPLFKKQFSVQELDAVRLKYQLPHQFLLTVGTIEHRKNTLLIVEALTLIKYTIPLVIVGRPTKYMHQIQRYIQKNRLQNRIIFIHQIDFEELPLVYQMARIFIYPSFFEGFGIPIIEAINSRIPVITSIGSCFSEAGGPHSQYVDPNDKQQMAEEIERIMGDEIARQKMIEESQKYITRFNSKQIAQNLMGVYNELL